MSIGGGKNILMDQTYLICFNEPLDCSSFQGILTVRDWLRVSIFEAEMICDR
jgi:hypothetical protein